ncbi:MAG: DUF3696 domain-containing protein [Chloroflexota bacterium]
MLKKWRVQRFKPIIDSGELELAELTVLSGQNSSGKSSLLQSILMVSQTLSNRIIDRPLITNGLFIQLGTFKDILNTSASPKTIILSFEMEIGQSIPQRLTSRFFRDIIGTVKVTAEFKGSSNIKTLSAIEASKISVENIQLEFIAEKMQHNTWLKEEYPNSNRLSLNIQKLNENSKKRFFLNVPPEHMLTLFDTEDDTDKYYQAKFRKKTIDGEFLVTPSHFLPNRFYQKYNLVDRQNKALEWYLDRILDGAIEGLDIQPKDLPRFLKIEIETIVNLPLKTGFLTTIKNLSEKYKITPPFEGVNLNELLHWIKPRKLKGEKDKKRTLILDEQFRKLLLEEFLTILDKPDDKAEDIEPVSGDNPYFEIWWQVSELISEYFASRIRYLGPLRADPQATQKFSSSSEPDDVGTRGEFAAAVYEVNQNNIINFYDPVLKAIGQTKLKEALNTWVSYLNVGDQVQIEMVGQNGVSWQVIPKKGDTPLPLTGVGVGVSQVLPILIMGLLAPEGTLLIIEQPELHLHPRVQSRLGEFFIGLTQCNKQCLIETHSENLINQLRLHIVQAGGQEKSNCNIYFASQDEQGATQFESIKISPDGAIENWPEGFFDETIQQESQITTQSIISRVEGRS